MAAPSVVGRASACPVNHCLRKKEDQGAVGLVTASRVSRLTDFPEHLPLALALAIVSFP